MNEFSVDHALVNKDRLLPSFLIIGGIKCGTSSLYRYLSEHPNVLPSMEKEPGYFSHASLPKLIANFDKYCSLFPERSHEGTIETNWVDLAANQTFSESSLSFIKKANTHYISFEATANTYFSAKPGLVKTVLPNAKIIMLVRDPALRFISHYRMFKRFNREGREGFDMPPLLAFVNQEIRAFKEKKSTRILHQGRYIDYLRRWRAVYGSERLLVLPTGIFENPLIGNNALAQITDFLDLPRHDFSSHLKVKHNQAQKIPMNERVLERLNHFYKRSNQQLNSEFGISFDSKYDETASSMRGA